MPLIQPTSQQAIDALDAARYRQLRGMHWSGGGMCVVRTVSVLRLGTDTYSGSKLDYALDNVMCAGQEKR